MDKATVKAFLNELQELCEKYKVRIQATTEHGPMDGHFGSPTLSMVANQESYQIGRMISEIIWNSPNIYKKE